MHDSPGKSADPTPRAGDVIAGRFVVEEVLGAGAMGVVVACRSIALKRRVAVKLVKAGSEAHPRFEREAVALASLESDHVVRVLEYGTSNEGAPYLVMEFLVGRDLLQELRARGRLPIDEAVDCVLEACAGLSEAHARGIVHRDIKPGNLFLAHRAGEPPRVKVLDFGISKRLGPHDHQESLTQASTILGSPAYMSPEQVRHSKLVDHRTDVWSLGVVLHRMVTGKQPFAAEGFSALCAAVVTDAPPALRVDRAEAPIALESVVLRCLEKDPARRYQTVAELAAALVPFASARGARAAAKIPRESIAPSSPGVPGEERPPRPAEGESSGPREGPSLPLASAGTSSSPWTRTARRARGVWTLAGATVLATLAVLALRRPPAPAPARVPPPGPTAITEVPPPKTTPDALAAYQQALRAVRTDDMIGASIAYRRAIELDPQLAQALLRYAHARVADQPTEAREYFHRATQLQDRLSERDRGLLHAFEPDMIHEPGDRAETRARLGALAARYPLDAEIAFELARSDLELASEERALVELSRAIELDPEFGMAFANRAETLAKLGDLDGALAASRDCERVAPGVADCYRERDVLLAQEGRCDELERDARHVIMIDPATPTGYLAAAQAMVAQGKPMAAAREAIAQARARGDWSRAPLEVTLLDVNLAVLEGDFAEAARLAAEREALPAVAESADAMVHGVIAWARVEIALETGDVPGALAVAASFHERSDAWSHASAGLDFAAFDVRLPMLAVLVHGGRISRAKLVDARRAWLAGWDRAHAPGEGGGWWIMGYARQVSTPDEALEALEALPGYQPAANRWAAGAEYPVGNTYLLAGKVDEAALHLARAAKACTAAYDPFDQTRAHLALGRALELKNDASGACAAYGLVLDRWGRAKPRSVTADAARARIKALKCAR